MYAQLKLGLILVNRASTVDYVYRRPCLMLTAVHTC